MPTAAILIIGNEILTGKFVDENSPYLIRRLRELGVDLVRISVLPDVIEVLAPEIRHMSATCDWVFSTGGVGPTHDDVTFAAMAAAFERPILRNPAMERILRERLNDRFTEQALRMADVPDIAELWWDGNVIFPLVVVRNVVVFPGVPSLLQLKFEAVAHRFASIPTQCRRITTEAAEWHIADTMTEAANRWPMVAIGSYPRFETRPHTVIITMESRDRAALDACEQWLQARIPPVGSSEPG